MWGHTGVTRGLVSQTFRAFIGYNDMLAYLSMMAPRLRILYQTYRMNRSDGAHTP